MEAAVESVPSRNLTELEAVIERGLSTFVDVGMALARIRDERLYKETHTDFDTYCRNRWKFNRQRAYQMIEAAAITAEMSTIVDTPMPSRESQVRELARVPEPAQRAETWQAAVEQHGPEPTAKEVREVIADRFPKFAPDPKPKPSKPAPLFVPGYIAEPIDLMPAPIPDDSNDLLESIADPDDLANDRLRLQFWREFKHFGLLIQLQPDAIAASLERDEPSALRLRFADARMWMDAIEQAMKPRGLRVVG